MMMRREAIRDVPGGGELASGSLKPTGSDVGTVEGAGVEFVFDGAIGAQDAPMPASSLFHWLGCLDSNQGMRDKVPCPSLVSC